MIDPYCHKTAECSAYIQSSTFIPRLGNSVKRHIGTYSFVAGLLGLIFGSLYEAPFLEHLIPLSLFVMLFPVFLDMDTGRIMQVATSPRLLVTALALNFIAAPVLMYGLIEMLSSGTVPDLMVGLFLYSMIPGGGMGPAYTGMINGNINLSIAITTISMLLSIGAVPLWSWFFMGKIVPVPAILILQFLFIIIVMPMAVATLFKRLVIRYKGDVTFEHIKEPLKDMSGIGLLLMLFIVFALQGKYVMSHPDLMVKIFLPAVFFSSLLLIGTTLIGRVCRLNYEDSVAFTISSTVKNNAISMALAMSVFGGQAALVIAVTGPFVQLPIMLGYIKIRSWLSVQNMKI